MIFRVWPPCIVPVDGRVSLRWGAFDATPWRRKPSAAFGVPQLGKRRPAGGASKKAGGELRCRSRLSQFH
jgi:hypothetical protein